MGKKPKSNVLVEMWTYRPTEHRPKNTLRALEEQSQNRNSKLLKMLKKHKPAFSFSLASVTLFSKSINAFMLSETILKILESWLGDHYWMGLIDMLCHFGQIVI